MRKRTLNFEETDQKYEGTYQFKSFWKKRKQIKKKMRKRTKNIGNSAKNIGKCLENIWIKQSGNGYTILVNRSNFELRGISEKFQEIAETPKKNLLLRGFRLFLIRFHVEAFPCHLDWYMDWSMVGFIQTCLNTKGVNTESNVFKNVFKS